MRGSNSAVHWSNPRGGSAVDGPDHVQRSEASGARDLNPDPDPDPDPDGLGPRPDRRTLYSCGSCALVFCLDSFYVLVSFSPLFFFSSPGGRRPARKDLGNRQQLLHDDTGLTHSTPVVQRDMSRRRRVDSGEPTLETRCPRRRSWLPREKPPKPPQNSQNAAVRRCRRRRRRRRQRAERTEENSVGRSGARCVQEVDRRER